MGIDENLGLAIVKAHLAAGSTLPSSGNVFISVRDGDKPGIVPIAKGIIELGFTIFATTGTAKYLQDSDVPCEHVNKISQGRPHILDKVQDGQISWIVNTSLGKRTTEDAYTIRRAVLDFHLPYTTTISGAAALVKGMQALSHAEPGVQPVQYFT